MSAKFPQCLLWADFETTGLPVGNDFSGVHILEVAVVVTDLDLEMYEGFHGAVKMTQEAAEALRANEYVLNMHRKNGLIVDSRNSTMTLAEAEQEIIKLLKDKTTFDKGEFMIAGSGVAAYDHPLIKAKMPELDSYLAYYPFDIGVVRRAAKILTGGKDVVNPTPRSYQDGVKEHRAWDDVLAHIEEGTKYRDWFRSVS